MMLTIAIVVTIFVCATLTSVEVALLSVNISDIEAIKRRNKKRGEIVEKSSDKQEKILATFRAVRTSVLAFLATLIGAQFALKYAETNALNLLDFSVAFTLTLFVFSDFLARKIAQKKSRSILFYSSHLLKVTDDLSAILELNFRGKQNKNKKTDYTKHAVEDDLDIVRLASKREKDGELSKQERKLVENSLSLDDIEISQIMTPRTVVMALDEKLSIGEIFNIHPNLPFSRIPVFSGSMDKITGVVRRRDILTAKAKDKDALQVGELKSPALFLPENARALDAMRQMIKKHQRIAIAVDEFAALAGVLTLEDIFEHLLGSEIFELDDIAVDMRQLAREKSQNKMSALATKEKKD